MTPNRDDRDDRTESQKMIAALFLLALAVLPVAGALLWGRMRQTYAPPPSEENLYLSGNDPALRELNLTDRERQFLMERFLQALNDSSQDNDSSAADGPEICQKNVDTTVYATIYGPSRSPIRHAARKSSLLNSVLDLAEQIRSDSRYEERGYHRLDDPRVRIDVITSEMPVDVPQRLQAAELHIGESVGATIRHEDQLETFLPGDFAEKRPLTYEGMLDFICQEVELPPDAWQERKRDISLCRSLSFINTADDSSSPISLRWGLPLVGEVSEVDRTRSAQGVAGFIAELRDPASGQLQKHYDATTDIRGSGADLRSHARALSALSRYVHTASNQLSDGNREDLLTACRDAIGRLVDNVRSLPDEPPVAFATVENDDTVRPSILLTAELLHGLGGYRRATDEEDWDDLMERCADFLLLTQNRDGVFSLPEDMERSRQNGNSAEDDLARRQSAGVKALITAYEELGQSAYLAGAKRAISPLEARVESEDAQIPHDEYVLAAAALARHLPAERYSQTIQKILGPRLERQMSDLDAPTPMLAGALSDPWPPPTSTTAQFMKMFASASYIGRQAEGSSAERFAQLCEKAARRAARYIVQFQFTPDNSYYVLTPTQARGGIRKYPGSNRATLSGATRALAAFNTFAQLQEIVNKADDTKSQN
ncbi:MAG: hypothetical protein ACOCQ9_01110 [Candidatus Brocadiia bacterium]